MKTQFYIILSLKTPQGFVDYEHYSFGNDREVACELFGQLQGSEKIKTIFCTLDELGVNCKLIAREIFRLKNLEELI